MTAPSPFTTVFALSDGDKTSYNNIVDTDSLAATRGSSHIRRRRATRACLGCRARKVRCNVTENEGPCTNCRLDGLECVVRRRKRARPQQFQVHCFKQDPNYLSTAKKNVITIEENGRLLDEEYESSRTMLESSGLPLDLFNPDLAATKGNLINMAGERLIGDSIAPASNVNPNHPVNESENSSPYSNLSQQMDLGETMTFIPRIAQLSTLGKPSFNTSLPAYIKPLQGQVAQEDIGYLLQKGALTLPEPGLRNALLQGFVEYVYPYMPVIDLQEFVEIVSQGDGKRGQLSLLVFQAVMFAGSAFIDMKHLSQAGYVTRRVARRALFRKVRLLYEFDSEPEVISQIQSLLLMTYYFNRPNEQKDLWYWGGIVVSLAHRAGLQRDPKNEAITSPVREQHLRKRLWWSVFMRDQMIALGMRRLPRIGKEDYNVLVLRLEDFDCDDDLTNLAELCPTCSIARDIFHRRQLAIMCMEKAKLCILIPLLLISQYTMTHVGHAKSDLMLAPKMTRSDYQQSRLCLQELGNWNSHLPRICLYDSTTALSHCESPVMIIHKAILRMIYLTTLSAVYRPEVLPVCPWSTSTTTPLYPKATDIVDPGQAAIHRAANEIACIAQDLQNLDLVRFLPTTVVTALLPAMMIHLLDIKSHSSQTTFLMPSSHLFGGCMRVMHLLHEMYASDDFAIEFIEDTARKANINVTITTLPRNTLSLTDPQMCIAHTSVDFDESSTNWSPDQYHNLETALIKGTKIGATSTHDAGDGKRQNIMNKNKSVPSRQSTRGEFDILNFLNLGSDELLNNSPSSADLTPLSEEQIQQTRLAASWNAALDSRNFHDGTKFANLDGFDMENAVDCECVVDQMSANNLLYSRDSLVGYDFSCQDLFSSAA